MQLPSTRRTHTSTSTPPSAHMERPTSTAPPSAAPTRVPLLILGAGWTSTFLVPLLDSRGITHARTTRNGRDGTISFVFDPSSTDKTPYTVLPPADAVLITFPITVPGATQRLLELYAATHEGTAAHWVQFGSTGVWEGEGRMDRHAPWNGANERAREEQMLLETGCGAVINLAGLWGGARDPRNWIARVAGTKEKLREKGSLHLIHGEDVARAVLEVVMKWDLAVGERWLLTDMRSYDWWNLALAWGSEECKGWAMELMREEDQRVLPRDVGRRGKNLDSREFWMVFGLHPKMSLFTR